MFDSIPDISSFPKTLIHTDIGLHNTVVNSAGEIIFIDWDDAGVGYRILDIAFPLLSIFVEGNVFNRKCAEAFYKTYFSETHLPLTENEKTALFDVSLFFCLIYLPYGNADKGWERLQKSLTIRESVEDFISNIY